VLGLCGGYQMLGRGVADPHGVEGKPGEAVGLGLLHVDTVLAADKTLRRTRGQAFGAVFEGYEMHLGDTTGPACTRPFALLEDGRHDGAISADERVLGSYIHGSLASTDLRRALLTRMAAASGGADYASSIDTALDEIAAGLEACLDVDALLALALGATDR
jgi:adenosylcobyric acid synthase